MAEVKFPKGTEMFELFQDYWKLVQGLWEVENLDSYWENVILQTDNFYKKYKTDFARSLALSLVNELDRKSSAQQ